VNMLPDFLKGKTAMSRFIQSQHPKHSIAPEFDQVRSILKLGWIAQPKLNGHRLQIHITPERELTCYTRKGTLHTKNLSTELKISFESYANPEGHLCLEGEWLKDLNEVHLFDVLRFESNTLSLYTYQERYGILKDIFKISPHLKLVRVLRKETDCMRILSGNDEKIEGLVFKAWTTKGWPDTAIVRCLKQKK